jgi:hypothetical protein
MSAEEKKALMRRYFEAIDAACQAGNADVLDEFAAPDFVTHNPPEWVSRGLPPKSRGGQAHLQDRRALGRNRCDGTQVVAGGSPRG